jgi:hypothetical protein
VGRKPRIEIERGRRPSLERPGGLVTVAHRKEGAYHDKVALMGSVLGINVAEWQALVRYLAPSLKYWVLDKHRLRLEHLQRINEAGWDELLHNGDALLARVLQRDAAAVTLGQQAGRGTSACRYNSAHLVSSHGRQDEVGTVSRYLVGRSEAMIALYCRMSLAVALEWTTAVRTNKCLPDRSGRATTTRRYGLRA